MQLETENELIFTFDPFSITSIFPSTDDKKDIPATPKPFSNWEIGAPKEGLANTYTGQFFIVKLIMQVDVVISMTISSIVDNAKTLSENYTCIMEVEFEPSSHQHLQLDRCAPAL